MSNQNNAPETPKDPVSNPDVPGTPNPTKPEGAPDPPFPEPLPGAPPDVNFK